MSEIDAVETDCHVAASPRRPETGRHDLARLNMQGIAVIVLSDILWAELRRNAAECGLPLKTFVREILESEAASSRLPNVRIEGEREPTGAHLPGTPKNDGFYPDPEMCYHVRFRSGPASGAE